MMMDEATPIDKHLVTAAASAMTTPTITTPPTAAVVTSPSSADHGHPPAAVGLPNSKPVVHSLQALSLAPVSHQHHSPSSSSSSSPPLLEPSLPDPYPLPSALSLLDSLPTPIHEDASHHLDLSLGLAAAAILPSTDVTLPTPPVLRSAHNLRLPSFDILGIAAPHPDRLPLNRSSHSFSSLGAGPLSNPDDPLHALSPPLDCLPQTAIADPVPDSVPDSPKSAKPQVDRIVPTVTPPSEPGAFHWGSIVNLAVNPVGLGSPPNSDPSHSPSLNTTAIAPSSLGPVSVVRGPETAGLDVDMQDVSMTDWRSEVDDRLIIESGCLNLDIVRVLSHALPCPSLASHHFSELITAIHDRTTTNTAWINVFHALPGRFTLSELPKSPPSTPETGMNREEYFTTKIFDSAVAVPDYQLDSKLLPLSPSPVVPPGSVNVSIVERYIPPTNTNEFSEMFQFKGHSLLHDRLVELSSDNGVLLFIYPTKTGGQTFMDQWLSPIIDPLLRTLTVVHDLTSDLGKSLGQMSAVAHLNEFGTLKAQVERFCDALTTHSAGQASAPGSQATYQVIRASKEEIMLDRSAWANDWWIKQEKPRIRNSVTRYFRKAKKLPVDTEMTGTHLIQEVLDGVAKREYMGHEPSRGVEVGVFIIKKSK